MESPKEDKVKVSDDMEDCPSMIEHYRVGEKLGKGAFATVFKALDSESGDFVAIKRIRVDKIKSKQLMKLLAEGHLMEQLEHENVVKFLGALETQNHIHLVLEYVDSGSLHSVIQKYGILNEKLAAVYLRQILAGLAYLHENGVVHRDIKSHNMLINNAGVVKLADFGIAHLYGDDSGSIALQHDNNDVGSPYWMAPEVIQLIEASPASDIWSIGCTLIELLTGLPPYYALSKTAACFRMVEDENPPIPESLSSNVSDFLMRCFKKDPKSRATALELLEDEWLTKTQKKAPMRKYVSITNLPRFQVNAQESKKAAQKAAMVKKSISVTTLPRYAVNPTLSGEMTDFQSLRGTKDFQSLRGTKALEKELKKEKSPSSRSSLRIKTTKEPKPVSDLFGIRKKTPGKSAEKEKDEMGAMNNLKSGKRSSGRSGEKDEIGVLANTPGEGRPSLDELTPPALSDFAENSKKSGGSKLAKACSECATKFGFMSGRSVCDQCKESFCKNCISKKLQVPSTGKSMRLCGECLKNVSREERKSSAKKDSM